MLPLPAGSGSLFLASAKRRSSSSRADCACVPLRIPAFPCRRQKPHRCVSQTLPLRGGTGGAIGAMRESVRRAAGWGVSAIALLALAGCDLGPDYHRPDLEIPPAYRASTATAAAAWPAEDWWRGFGSPELTSLVDQARRENFDLLAAIARVRQADAQVRIAGAGLLPSLGVTAQRELAAGEPGQRRPWRPRPHSQCRRARLHGGAQRRLRAGLLGQDRGEPPGGGGERHVQPVRPADGGADRGDQRRQHLVHRPRRRGPARGAATQPRRCRANPGGDPRPAGRRHRFGARPRAAGGAGRWRARHHPRPAQPDGAAGHRAGHPDRAAAGGRHGAAGHTRYPCPAAGWRRPAVRIAATPAGRGQRRGAAHRCEFRREGGAGGVLPADPAHRLGRLRGHRAR